MANTTGPIQFTVPNPGGDNGIWGALLNSFFSFLDSCLYASREERNWTVTGGGRLRWETTGNTLSFTEDIVFRSPYTTFTFTIPTSLSPITIPSDGQVAVCTLTRKPTVNTVASAINVIAGGAMTNTQAVNDSNYFVFAQRVGAGATGKLLLPWAKRFIFNGDEAYLNVGQTLFEKIATERPVFRSASLTSIICEGGTATLNGMYPACIQINGKLYVNYGNVTCNLAVNGLNGLDTGALALNTTYYMYAVPNGDQFGLVASITPPTGAGPTGFTNTWTYLGAFVTEAASANLIPFRHSAGRYLTNKAIQTVANTTAIVPTSFNVTRCPAWVCELHLDVRFFGTVINSVGRISSINDVAANNMSIMNPTAGAAGINRHQGTIPIIDPNAGIPRIWVWSSVATATTQVDLNGWTERLVNFR